MGAKAAEKPLTLGVHIPFLNLRLQYESIQSEIDQAVQSVFQQAQFIGGTPVKKFEKDFATLFGMPLCISTGNGTDSLFIILKALNIQAGDEVITPAFGCIPSAEVISLTGAQPVFCDVDPNYCTIDSGQLLKKITPKTKAVMAVHLYGQAAPVHELKKICDEKNIYLIEDCAQAHLTKAKNQLAGTVGVASAFSFYPTKNLGAYGDAGCILTHDATLAEKMRRLRNHGALKKDDHEIEGMNSRMDTLQAAVLSVKLKYLNHWNARRAELANLYKNLLADVSQFVLPNEHPDSTHTYHIFCIQTSYRDSLKKYLAEHGVETLIHYPKGLPFTPAYRHLHRTEAEFPITAQLQNTVLSLPLYAELKNEEVTYIAQLIRQYFS